MHKKFEINRTKIKGSCQSGRKVVTHDSNSDLPLDSEEVIEQIQKMLMYRPQFCFQTIRQ